MHRHLVFLYSLQLSLDGKVYDLRLSNRCSKIQATLLQGLAVKTSTVPYPLRFYGEALADQYLRGGRSSKWGFADF